ncbi:heme uptake protein IsdC [Bacillus sp. FJAT-50079]|uniref:heme uptake protein IsdC n=1 Tax=Bacillus sp. FJAT-50079 TaxID=2833577 RepID=UPI001BC8D3CC|nr:heme uptake protein IsdC [Bacillus sp. FJAT-50079]MBS4207898.1 heme uptake protein IsdC [Bacillus sp. FJAT-50079]
MKSLLRNVASLLFIIVVFFNLTQSQFVNAASKYADGEHSLPFTVLKGDSDERSMTNDYLVSPAKLVVKDGKNLVQVTLKNSSWWEDFSIPSSSISVLSDSNDTRVVQFEVKDLEQIVAAKIHVIVPDINYDNKYDVRFKFDPSGLALANTNTGDKQTSTNEESASGEKASDSKKVEENPQTGDQAQILLLSLMLIGATVFLVRRMRTE